MKGLFHFAAALLVLLSGMPAPVFAQSRANPYNAQALALEQQYASATAPRQAVLLHQLYELREYVDDAAQLTTFFARIEQDQRSGPPLLLPVLKRQGRDFPSTNPLVRDQALYLLARMQRHAGNLDAAAASWHALGFVSNWAVLGPFSSGNGAGRAEDGFDAARQYQNDSGKSLGWRRVPAAGGGAPPDLSTLFAHGPAVVFTATAVYSAQPRAVALRFGADSPVAVYVNGQAVGSGKGGGFAFDQYSAGARLQAGWNAIVVKLSREGEGSWRFALRVTEPAGGGLALPAASDQKVHAAAAVEPPAAIANLLTEAEQAVATAPHSAEALETLGLLECARGRGGELDHLERAARLASTPVRWLEVANACDDTACTFSALNATAAAGPSDARVQGALARYYFGRGQMEKARTLLRRAITATPDDFVLREQLADLYVSAGLNSVALAEYRKLETEFPAPLWLRRELAARYEDLGLLDRALALRRSVLAAEFDSARDRTALVRIYERRGDSAALRACYADEARLDPSDPRPLAALAQLDAGAGNYAQAVAGMRSALVLAPGDARLHQQLADVLDFAGRKFEAHAELTLAADADPALDDTRRLTLHSGGAAGADAAYLVNTAELSEQAHREPPRDPASAIELADVRIERVRQNGLSSVHVQQVTYLASEQGARDYATRAIPYAGGSQRLEVIAARAYKPDGRVVEAEDAGDAGVADAGFSTYYDSRSRQVRFPNLEKGDVVELEYRLTPETVSNPYGDYFGELVTFGSSLPRRLQRYVLVTPAARKFYVWQERMPHDAQVSVAGGERVWEWEARNLAPVVSEPRGPTFTELAPYVHVSTLGSWQEVGRWYARLIAPQFTLDSALREALRALLEGKTTDQEKIAAIHQFVLRNTHYVALEFGEFNYKPYPVSQVYARRFGDCKDKASLMIALLRAAGIDADIALVRMRHMGDVAQQATSIAIFDHAVVYVPKYDLWLDGTAEYAGPRELPLEDQGAMALTVAQNGDAQLRRIPVTLPMENYTHREVMAQVESDGRIEFTGSAYTRGEDAPGLRRDFEVRERQRDSFRNRLAEVLPSLRLDQVQVDGANDVDRDVVVNFRGALDTYAGRRTILLAPSWMHRSYVQTLAALPARTQDLLLPAPWTTEEELHFTLPAGARVDSPPADQVIQSAFGTAVLRYRRKGNELVITTSVQFRQLRITPAEYGAFRGFCTQIENSFRNEIKVVL
jgi:transglutaminase-like putative cysteine protease/tetratricopeptide (TPR) repeat protein